MPGPTPTLCRRVPLRRGRVRPLSAEFDYSADSDLVPYQNFQVQQSRVIKSTTSRRALRHANYQNLHVLTRRTCTNKLQHHACFVIQRASNNRPRIKLSHSSNYFPAYLPLVHNTRSTCRKLLRTTRALLTEGQQTLSRYRALFFVATTTTHFCLLLRSLLFSNRTCLNS